MANEIIRPTALPPRTSPVASEVTVSDNGASVAGVTWTDGVNAAVPVASQAESEAGVNNVNRMTPLTTKQAIDAQVPPKIAAAITDLNLGSAAQAQASDFATAAQGLTADSAVQPGDLAAVATSGDYDDLTNKPTARLMPAGGTTDQSLVKASDADYDTVWVTSAAATAVSYAAQTLTGPQQAQARANISAVSPSEAVLNTGAQVMTGPLTIDGTTAQALIIKLLASNGTGYLRFQDSEDEPVSYIGYGSTGNDNLTITRNVPGIIQLNPGAGGEILLSQAVTLTNPSGTGVGGFTGTNKALGNISGTVAITPVGGNIQSGTKTAALTLSAPVVAGVYTIIIELTNSGATGAYTLSGFTKVDGDAFTLTSGHKFQLHIAKTATTVTATVKALQ